MKPHLLQSAEPLLQFSGNLQALCGKIVEDAQVCNFEFIAGANWRESLNSLTSCKDCLNELIWDEHGNALIERMPFYVYTIASKSKREQKV